MDKKEITTGGAPGGGSKPQLSRREREEIDKAKAKAHYQKMHAAGNFFLTYDQSIASTKTKYIQLNTKTQVF